jgi:hypothetical protein
MLICGHRRLPRFVAPALALVLSLAVTMIDVPRAEALWSASTAPGGLGEAAARSMTPGQQPLAVTRPSTSDTVEVSWASSTGSPVEGYELRVYDAVTDELRVVGGTCAGLVIVTACTDSGVPDGQWSYTVTPRRAGWSGSESARSAATWVDTVAPTVEFVFPEPGGIYNEASWDGGCPSPGACGSGDDVGSGLVSGGVTARQVSTGLYWDGAAFASSVEVLLVPGVTGWDFPISNFPVDGVFTMEAMATDAVGNTTFESATFSIDREGPAVPAAFPVEGGVYNTDSWNAGCPNPGFCGTGGEVTDIVAAEISVRHLDSELYWDGTAFASATEVLFLITDPAGAAFAITNFAVDGSYTVRGVLTDSASNTTSVSTSFRIDRAPPTVTPIFPLPGGTYNAAMWDAGCVALFGGSGLCGVGSDESGPMSSSLVSIRDVTTGLYWDGTAFATPLEQRFDITGVGFLAFPSSNFLNDGPYAVRVVVRDLAGNATSIADTMTIDRTAPTLTLAFPTNGGTYNTATWNAGCPIAGLCGTTSDPTSGVASTRLSIRQGSGNYWDGTAFTSTTEVFVSVVSGEDLPFPAANFPADDDYTIGVLSNDFAGNTATASATFTIDRTAPTATLAFPADGGTYATTSWNTGCPTPGFCGTITDTSGPVTGQVSIRQGTGSYWNGTAFASITETFEPFTTADGTPFPITQFSDGTYTVRLVATDNPGNTASSSRTFTIDRAAPTITGLTESNANGRLATGDTYSITFSEPLDVTTICSTWSGTGDKSLINATITVTNNASNDIISSVTSPTCTLRAGTMATRNDYVFSTATFTSSSVAWTESTRTLRITFGNRASGSLNSLIQSADTSDYTPTTGLTDRAANPLATTTFTITNRRF